MSDTDNTGTERPGQGTRAERPAKETSETSPKGLDKLVARVEARRDQAEEKRAAGQMRGQRIHSKTEKMLTRVLSGAIYLVLMVGSFFAGQWTTTIMVEAVAWLCCSEFYRMTRISGRMPNEVLGLTFAVLFPLAARMEGISAMLIAVYLMLMFCGVWYVITPRANIADVAVTAFGPLYTSLAFSSVVLLRMSAPGLSGALLTFGVMGSIWLNDTCAYFVGSRFGRHKLAPRISPNKSIEGFWGGVAGTLIIWLIMAVLHIEGLTYPVACVAGPLVAIMSVAGDLFESRVKRGVGVKDSGTLIPGHGGMLDRTDSQLFGCMVAYLVLHIGGII